MSVWSFQLLRNFPEKLGHIPAHTHELCSVSLTLAENKNTFKMLHYDSCSTPTFIAAISDMTELFFPCTRTLAHISIHVENSKLPNKIKLLTNFSMCVCITS